MADAKAATTEKLKRTGNADLQKGKPKHRSPNYPVIGLRKAVERVEEFYKEYKRHWTPIGVAQAKWGYKAHSGAGNQVVAAIRAYGLLDIQGDGDKRSLKISDVGWRVVENHKDRPELLKASATAPSLHADLWKKYGSEGLPPDEVIRYYLKFERTFNPESVDSFIAQFRDTIAFANLNSSDKIPDGNGAQADEDEMNSGAAAIEPPAKGEQPPPTKGPKPPPPGSSQDTFTLDEGPVTLVYPANLSEHSLEDFKDWIELAVRKIERSITRRKSTSEPQPEAN